MARENSGLLLPYHCDMAVAGALLRVAVVSHRAGIAVAPGRKPQRVDALLHQVAPHSLGALLREAPVPVGLAYVIGVARYFQSQGWPLAQLLRQRIQTAQP